MRIIMFLILAAVLSLAGCENRDYAELVSGNDGELAVTFGTAPPTRAFFDGNPAGEPWEREIRTLEAIICDGAGNVLHRRPLNRTEIDAGKALFSRMELPADESYTVYLLVNYDSSGISSGFDQLTDSRVSKYNGSYEQLRQGCPDPDGFAMVAVGTLTPANTLSNPLHLTLRRSVSKLELKTTFGDNLSVYHSNGELEVTETVINSIVRNIPLFGGTAAGGETSLAQIPFEQEPSREYRNVFYLFAHPTLIPEITLHVRFYPNGKAANPTDFSEHTYTFSPDGSIAMNTYYRLQARISELDEIIVPTCYTITYDANDGWGGTQVQAEAGSTHFIYDEWSAGVDGGGRPFSHWNTRPDNTGEYYNMYQEVIVTEDLTLYAIWGDSHYNINYYPNNGTGHIYTEGMMGSGEYYVLDPWSCGITRPGYEFTHWMDSYGVIRYPGDVITVYGNIDFIAHWVPVYKVTYHSNNGSGDLYVDHFVQWIPTEAYCVQSHHYMWTHFQPGDNFVGWNTKADGTGEAYDVYEEIRLTGDLDLYAQWQTTP